MMSSPAQPDLTRTAPYDDPCPELDCYASYRRATQDIVELRTQREDASVELTAASLNRDTCWVALYETRKKMLGQLPGITARRLMKISSKPGVDNLQVLQASVKEAKENLRKACERLETAREAYDRVDLELGLRWGTLYRLYDSYDAQFVGFDYKKSPVEVTPLPSHSVNANCA